MTEPRFWKIVEGTTDSWLQLEDPDGFWSAVARWDGCVHLHRYGNVPLDVDPKREGRDCCDDYIHICDIDDCIKRLQALKEIAQDYFDGTIHQQYWEDRGG